MADVAIVGAGVGGLCAAIDLAAAGHSVTVFEALPEVGGKLGRVVIDGVEADTGPSVLTMPEVFDDLFRTAGTSLSEELELIEHDEVADLRWPDGTRLVLHREPEASIDSVRSTLGDEPARQLARFLDYAASIWNEAAPAFVFGDAPTFTTALAMGFRRPLAMRRIDPMRAMLAGIDAHVAEPHLRDLLARYATYNGSDPRTAPATLNCIAHVELTEGCYGVRGGMFEIARALERVARRLEVDFRLGEPVREILRDGKRVVGLVTDAGRHATDAVVVNADVAHLFTELLQDLSYSAPAPSMSGWTALIRTTRRERLAHGVLFTERYLGEFEDIFDRGVAPTDPTVYICAQGPAHRRGGFDEEELLFCMANAPATSEDRGSDIDQLRERVLGKLRQAEWIAPDARIVWERTPTQLATLFPGTHGAIYGASSNSRFAAFQRPANRVSGTHGLYLASGSAHPGGGVPLCALSGRAASRAVGADFPLRP